MPESRSTTQRELRWRSSRFWRSATGLLAAVGVLLTPLSIRANAAEGASATKQSAGSVSAARRIPGPAQPGSLVYGALHGAERYAAPGGLVVAGRANFAASEFKRVAAAGGTVLLYMDPIVDEAYGPYHKLLFRRSTCGPAVARWPGSPRANEYGYLTDFRRGSVLQSKLRCVLERMVRQNPHMGGWFVDDLGSRSWFTDLPWSSLSTRSQSAYRLGAVEIARTFRRVADDHRLIFLVNGTWSGGTLATAGGGYPVAARSGNALADGAVIEHHDDQLAYFGPYACSSQWAAKSAVTRGEAVNLAITSSDEGLRRYAASPCYSHVSLQNGYDFAATPWGRFRDAGLPTGSLP